MESSLDQQIAKQKLLARNQRHNSFLLLVLALSLAVLAYFTSDAFDFISSDAWWAYPLAFIAFRVAVPLLFLAAILASGQDVAQCPECGEPWVQWGFFDDPVDDWASCEKCGLKISHVKPDGGRAL